MNRILGKISKTPATLSILAIGHYSLLPHRLIPLWIHLVDRFGFCDRIIPRVSEICFYFLINLSLLASVLEGPKTFDSVTSYSVARLIYFYSFLVTLIELTSHSRQVKMHPICVIENRIHIVCAYLMPEFAAFSRCFSTL